MKKTGIRSAGILLLLVVGTGILLYPTVSDRWNQRRAEELITQYNQASEKIGDADKKDMLDAAKTYNSTLVGSSVPDAFADRELQEDPEYWGLLNPDKDGVMGSVEIPCISVHIPIFHYTTTEILEKGAGHLHGSSLPVGGESTHSVISAHRGLPQARFFTDLDRVVEGDVFYLHVLGDTLAYETDQIKVVEPDETESLAITEGKDYCTLLTCTPYGINSQRLLVRGHRIAFSEAVYNQAKGNRTAPPADMIWMRIVCLVAGSGLGVGIVFVLMRIKNRKAGAKTKQR